MINEESLFFEYFGVRLSTLKEKNEIDNSKNLLRLAGVVGWLVSQEHLYRVSVTPHIFGILLREKVIEVTWKAEPTRIQTYIMEQAWNSPVGLNGSVIHLKIEEKKDEENTPDGDKAA